MKIDEFVEKAKEERNKELEDYRRFFYFEFGSLPDIFDNRETSSPKPTIVTKLQEVQTESQGPELQFEAIELMPTKSEGPKP